MIPANITAELTSLQAQVTAAAPLTSASHATVTALQLNAAQLVSDVQNALTAPNNLLDVFEAPVSPTGIIAGVLSLLSVAEDQNTLSLMRGLTGRAASNLSEIV